jgi:hypothetical protein
MSERGISFEKIGDFFGGGDSIGIVDPSKSSTQGIPQESGGFFGFLDDLGGSVIGSVPNILDNLTKRNNDPAPPQISVDQTRVGGDAKLTQTPQGFIKDNAVMLGAGVVLVFGLAVFLKK